MWSVTPGKNYVTNVRRSFKDKEFSGNGLQRKPKTFLLSLTLSPSPGERVAVSESMNRDLNRVSVWCNLWGMKLNASKTKTMTVSRSSTVHPQFTTLTLDGTVLEDSADLVILGLTSDAKMTFESHLCSVSSAAA